MGSRVDLFRIGLLAVSLTSIFSGSVLAKSTIVDGKTRLGILQNVPPTECWIESGCAPGQVCHISIRISGAPAASLLKALKGKVSVSPEFRDMGLTIYVSKDGNLDCDETEPDNVFCDIYYNVSDAKFEPALSCE